MNKRFLSLISLAIIVLCNVLPGQIISTPESRDAVLQGMEETLASESGEASQFTGVKSPFIAVVPKTPPPEKKVVEKKIPEVVEVLPDEQALAIISQQFKPLGSLILGNRGVLQMPNNQTIEKGSSFTADIQGNKYTVSVAEVTQQGYTLRLGTATISKNFLTTSGTAK